MKYVIVYLPVLIISLFIFQPTLAATGPGSVISFSSPINCSDPETCLGQLTSAAIKVATPILGIMVMWAGSLIMTARGNETQLKKGQHALWWSILGFVVILVASMLGGVIKDIIGS